MTRIRTHFDRTCFGFLWASLLALMVLLSTGCSVQRLYAPTAVLADVHVKIYDARIVGDDHVFVKMMVLNNTDVPVELDRDGISLRLPSGDILPHDDHEAHPYIIQPGERRPVAVHFEASDDIVMTRELYLIMGGVRFSGEDYARIIGEIPLLDTFDRLVEDSRLAGSAPSEEPTTDVPPGAASPVVSLDEGNKPEAPVRHTVGIDLSRLDREAFDELDGVELEERLLVRLVQDGFAVVAVTEKPDTIIFVRQEDDRTLLEVRGPAYAESREVADTGQDREALHHELAQKASALVHHTLNRTARAKAEAAASAESSEAAEQP